MTVSTPGIHHVTCIAGDPQRNIDFWVETLGLRPFHESESQCLDPEVDVSLWVARDTRHVVNSRCGDCHSNMQVLLAL